MVPSHGLSSEKDRIYEIVTPDSAWSEEIQSRSRAEPGRPCHASYRFVFALLAVPSYLKETFSLTR